MSTTHFRVSVCTPREISQRTISSWIDLEARAVEANAFLSPLFVLPAIRYIDPDPGIIIVLVEKTGSNTADLVSVGVFRERSANRHFPLRHLEGYRSIHSYLSGLLVDRDNMEDVVPLLFEYLFSKRREWGGLVYEKRLADSELSTKEKGAAADAGIIWTETSRSERAILIPAKCDESVFLRSPKKLRKNCERNMRRLAEIAEIDWRLVRGGPGIREATENLLRLENMGWKARGGTSLASSTNHALFFEEMIKGFEEHSRVFFTELSANREVIASTSNLVSGNTGFAFKIGWNEEYFRLSPGKLNEIFLVQRCRDMLEGVELVDSCASECSFMNDIWPWRRELVSGIYSTTAIGSVAARSMRYLKNLIR